MRTRARLDANHKDIADYLASLGCSVQSIATIGKGCPDLLIGHAGRNYIIEVKDGAKPPSERRLTPDERDWHSKWSGQADIAHSIAEAEAIVYRRFDCQRK